MKLNQNLFLILSFIFAANNSFAAGFATNSESASSLANSYAGQATGAHDISDSYTNPAILSDIKSKEFVISATYIKFDIDDDNGSGKFFDGTSVSSSRNKNGGTQAVVPALYFAAPINKDLTAGIAITSPFGLATKYNPNWVGRYSAVDSEITTTNINPMVSYKVNNQLSFGGGLEAQYIKARITNMVDVGAASGQFGSADGIGKAKGDDWGYGFNLGLKYKINDELQAGIGYRSKIKHKIAGQVQVDALNLSSQFTTPLITPEVVSFGLSYNLTNKSQLLYDTAWTRWSRINSLDINAQNSNLSGKTNLNWGDSFRHSFGFNYQANEKWQIKTGLAFEQGASRSQRNPRVPDNNKTLVSLGFDYRFNQNLAADFAYMHEFLEKSSSDLAGNNNGKIPIASLQTEYKAKVDVLGLSMKYDF